MIVRKNQKPNQRLRANRLAVPSRSSARRKMRTNQAPRLGHIQFCASVSKWAHELRNHIHCSQRGRSRPADFAAA